MSLLTKSFINKNPWAGEVFPKPVTYFLLNEIVKLRENNPPHPNDKMVISERMMAKILEEAHPFLYDAPRRIDGKFYPARLAGVHLMSPRCGREAEIT